MPRRGRPGLMGTMARTAVITGTATAVSGNVARRQQAKHQPAAAQPAAPQQQAPPPPSWEEQQAWAASQQAAAPAAPPPPSAPLSSDMIAQLKELAGLHEQGILTDDEFAEQKARILA